MLTFNPDASAGSHHVLDAMIVDRTARRADVMIGSHAPGTAPASIGNPARMNDTSPTLGVVMNFEQIGRTAD